MTSLKFIIAGGVLVLAVGYLILTGLQTSAVYYLTAGELKQSSAQLNGRQVRVAGNVAAGTVERLNGGLALRFVVQDESGAFPVVYQGGPVPDIFDEHVEVVVEGKLQPDGTFAADTLLAKCPSKFEDGGVASS